MADLSVTAANVAQGAGAVVELGLAGVAITAGQAVFLDTSDNRYKLSDADHATAANRAVRGIALNTAGVGQPLGVQRSGDMNLGATLTANTAYYLSNTAGGICPLADVGTGEYMTLIGIATSASNLRLGILSTGVAN